MGTGGIYSTASDLAAFGGALCGEGLLSQASLDEMASDQYLLGMWPEDSDGDAVAYSLGWDSVHMFPFSQNGIQALVKGGDTIVYHAGLVILPEYDMAAAVLTSGGISTYNQLAAAVSFWMPWLSRASRWRRRPPSPPPSPPRCPPS